MARAYTIMRITECNAKEIKDSRGNPTVSVSLKSADLEAIASVPSGVSTGKREAIALHDEDGRGVMRAIDNIENIIAPQIIGKDFLSLYEMDKLLLEIDGTKNKSRLGANATIGISIAAAKLFAKKEKIPTWKYISKYNNTVPCAPRLYMNSIEGGAHADFNLPFQEYIFVIKDASAKEAYRKATVVFERLGEIVRGKYGDVSYGDEGGYTFVSNDIREPYRLMNEAMRDISDIDLANDMAASEYYKDGTYDIYGIKYSSDDLLTLYNALIGEFNIKSIEDPFSENDIELFRRMVLSSADKTLIVGDDLTVTNPDIIREVIEKDAATAVIIKPNQIGTLTEVFKAVQFAQDAGWKIIVSHRGGETEDDFIADLAYGLGSYGLKAGAPSQKERRVKYERLLQIEEEMEK